MYEGMKQGISGSALEITSKQPVCCNTEVSGRERLEQWAEDWSHLIVLIPD